MPKTEKNSHDYYQNPQPVCPHCDTVCAIADNDWWHLYKEGTHEEECPCCEKTFLIASIQAGYEFTTAINEEDNDL